MLGVTEGAAARFTNDSADPAVPAAPDNDGLRCGAGGVTAAIVLQPKRRNLGCTRKKRRAPLTLHATKTKIKIISSLKRHPQPLASLYNHLDYCLLVLL